MTKWILLVLLAFGPTFAFTQTAEPEFGRFVNGYAEKISGSDFSYHSSVPDARESLLARATDGYSSIEWETSPALPLAGEEKLTFAWLAGIGSSPGVARFDLTVNNQLKFSFWADGKELWLVTGENGSTLFFRKEMTDQYGDRFGFMFLTLPVSSIEKGKPLRINVTGGSFGKTSWYMTFKFPLKKGFTFKALPAITEENGKQYQTGVASVLHFGKPAVARIFVGRDLLTETPVRFGYTNVQVRLPRVTKMTRLKYRIELDGTVESGEITQAPVRNWQVNFVQHSHTDIGYTRPQTEILAEHLRYIDYALDYCDLTDSYPEEAKFRWSCEASWAVDEYLKCRPADQIKRLKQRIKEGRIEVTGMYFNFDELPDEQILAASLQPLQRFREEGIAVKTAMQNDVNGIGWCVSEFFPDMGIRFLNMGTHGHRALICFDKPTLFWWESPSGKRMLAYRAEHYMTGNTVFKIHAGEFNRFEEELLSYLAGLEKKGYAYDLISIQHSGYLTDNSPPSTLACDMIRQWNEKYLWPKLKTATATAFFEEMESLHGSEFPVIRGAWPDWWTDGFGASAREVSAVRTAAADLVANTAGMAMAATMGASLPGKFTDRIGAANSALLFYTEHTVGYHGSVREPFHKNTMEQRALKESYAWEAGRRAKMIGEETMGQLQPYFSREKEPSLLVFNTLSYPRSGVVILYADHQIIPRYTPFALVNPDGKEAKAQPLESFSDGTTWAVWVDSIPAFGFRKYLIITGTEASPEKAPANISKVTKAENPWYALQVDTARAAISSLLDKALGREIIDRNAPWQAGEFIYETLDNRSQLETFKLDNYKRKPLESVHFEGFREGEIWNTFAFRGSTPAAIDNGEYRMEIRVFNTSKRIDLVYSIEKKMVTEPEGIYIAFPFQLEGGQLAFDVPGGEIRAGMDQIPGSANDWNTVQSYARLYNDQGQILLSSPEIPLMQFGGINTGRYKAGATPASTHIYGWPMNNYWTTNFNAYQLGGHTWSYTISGSATNSRQEAARAGQENRIPFLGRILPGGGNGDDRWQGSLIAGWPENTLLVSMMPEEGGKSAIVHLRETAGVSATLHLVSGISGAPLTCTPVDVTGNLLSNGTITVQPFESKFFRINF